MVILYPDGGLSYACGLGTREVKVWFGQGEWFKRYTLLSKDMCMGGCTRMAREDLWAVSRLMDKLGTWYADGKVSFVYRHKV